MEPLRQQLDQMRVGHERDLADGGGAGASTSACVGS